MTAPVEISVTRYVCPHCRRGHSKRRAAVEHIARCWRNPTNRTCKTCAHLHHEHAEPEVGLAGATYCAAIEVDGRDLDLTGEAPRVGCPAWHAGRQS
jgi:hypothetical protein